MRRIKIVLCILLAGALPAWGIKAHEMPFGVYFSAFNDAVSNAHIDSLHDLLGINFIQPGGTNLSRLNDYYSRGIQTVIQNETTAPPTKYSGAGYAIVQAEDNSSEIRFLVQNGRTDGDWFVTAPSGVVLDNLWFKQLGQYAPLYDSLLIEHQRTLRLSINRVMVDSTDTLGVLRLWNCPVWWDSLHTSIIDTTIITADSFYIAQSDTILWHFRPYKLAAPSHNPICFQLETSGACSLRVDYLEIYDYAGVDLLFNHRYDNEIKQYATSSWAEDKVLGWYLRDEPLYDQYTAAGYIAPMIADTTFKAFGDSAYGFTCFGMPVSFSLRDFFKVAHPPVMWTDHYPLVGGQTHTDDTGHVSYCPKTLYYGAGGSYYYGEHGLQTALNRGFIYDGIDSVKAAFRDLSSMPRWWVFIQCMGDMKLGSGYSNDFTLRPPTPSELSCMTYMALGYGAKGILFWPYDAYYNYSYGTYMRGIYDTLGNGITPTPLYGKIEHDINPFIKAIDSTLLNLDWDTSYYACDTHSVFTGVYLSSIHGWSDSPNPDTGWAQIGEFHNGSDKYIMLVNRACSSDTIGTEAPNQKFTLKLSSKAIGLGNKVYIIDLARNVKHTQKDGWVGISDTTKVSKKSDGTFHYQTTLRAGEGRLFKITNSSSH